MGYKIRFLIQANRQAEANWSKRNDNEPRTKSAIEQLSEE
jgi:hypothetical protein